MNAGLEILIKRMETNPEEFLDRPVVDTFSRWHVIIREFEGAFTKEDLDAYNEARRQMLEKQFTETVLSMLTEGKDRLPKQHFITRPSGTFSGGQIQGGYSLLKNNTIQTYTQADLTANLLAIQNNVMRQTDFKHTVHTKDTIWNKIKNLLSK